jgi:hypothetical protein
MTSNIRGKSRFNDAEITPRVTTDVPSGSDGQLAVVTDNPGIHLMVREGGVLVPAVDVTAETLDKLDQTTSNIEMSVDYTLGTSPPVGTIVHNQAEYDALAAPLKYVQDVIDILPLGIGHNVLAYVEDGIHYAKPDSLGVPGWGFAVATLRKSFLHCKSQPYDDTNLISYVAGTIMIRGRNRTALVPEMAGTITAASNGAFITAVGTTWTPNVYKGKMAIVLTGASAGLVFPIRENEATAIHAPGDNAYASGACTFEIYEPAAILQATTDGIDWYGYGLNASDMNSDVSVDFIDLQIESRNYFLAYAYSAGRPFNIYYCMLHVSADANICGMWDSSMEIYNSALHLDSGWEAASSSAGMKPGYLRINGCALYGSPSAGRFFIFADMLSTIAIFSSSIVPDAGWAGTCIYMRSSNLYAGGFSAIFGNSLCKAVSISGSWGQGDCTLGGHQIYVSSCTTILEVSNCRALTYPEYVIGWYCSDNDVGWDITGGSVVRDVYASRFGPGAIVTLKIDGIDYSAYYGTMVSGDQLVGPSGSVFMKV